MSEWLSDEGMGKGEELGSFGGKISQASKICRSNLHSIFGLSTWRETNLGLNSGDIKQVCDPWAGLFIAVCLGLSDENMVPAISQYLGQCLTHRRRSRNICWVNE